MKKLKRILSVLLAVIITVSTAVTGIEGFSSLFATKASAAPAEALRENADGSFRILQFSDIQDSSYLSAKALATVRLAVRKYNPNLIVLTGDNILNCIGDDVFHTTVDSFVDEFKDADGNKIPFAVTFGNHDYETCFHDENKTMKISLKDQYNYYLSKGAIALTQNGLDKSGVTTAPDNSATLWGTGYIDVYKNDGSDVSRRVILLNTGSYDEDNRSYFGRVGYNVETQREENYSKVVSTVNKWTNATDSTGKKIKCIVYQHIPLQEVYLGDSPETSILTKPTVPGSKTHACYTYINNDTITVNPYGEGRRQYVASTKNPTMTGDFVDAPQSSYNSTKDLFIALAKENVIGLFYGHDHANTVSAETKITYNGVQYTLTQGFGGGIDVYDGNYNGIDPQGSCYVIDKGGDLIKEAFSYTDLLTENITFPSGDENIKYIKDVALFNGTSFEKACDNARKSGYIPVTRAFSEEYNYADLNSNDRGSRFFTGKGSQFECIAYRQTTNPDEAITDLRIYVTTDNTYSKNNQTKIYTLGHNELNYRIVSGCDGNVNYGVTSNPSCAFLYYTKNKNAGSPLTELIVEVQESSSTDAYRKIDHRGIQTGNFVETFGTNGVASFSNVRIANMNLGESRSNVIGDSVYLFLKRYDGCSGYNTKTSYEVVTGVPETIYLNSPSTAFQKFANNTVTGNGIVTAESTSLSTGKLYFYCPDATAVTVTATNGDGNNSATLSSCSISNNGKMNRQVNGVFYAEIANGAVSSIESGVIKWVFSYSVAGSTPKTQIAYSTVCASQQANINVDKSALRNYLNNFNQSTFVKDADTTFCGADGFADALANACYVLGNPAATQADVDSAKAKFAEYADKTSVFHIAETADEDTDRLIDNLGGYIYGVCQPNGNYDVLSDTGFKWVRFDMPCPFDNNGYNNGNIKYVRNEYKRYKERCQEYKSRGFKIFAVTPYPKDFIADMGFNPIDDLDKLRNIILYLYNDLKGITDAFQITNEMGIATFMAPLTIEQAATYIGVQLEAINAEKAKNHEDFPIGYNCADIPITPYFHELMKPYFQYCDYVAADIYTGNQGEATAKDYTRKVNELHNITRKPVIITEFGFWSEGGLKTAEQKAAILYDNYGYTSEAQAIADGQNFINRLPSQFRKTLNLDYPGRESEWPELVFKKYSNHLYGETSPYTINDIPHSPEGQGQYFREIMTELRSVNCLAGLIIYCCQDHDVCFNCGQSWCPYETKFGLFNADGTPKASINAIKQVISELTAKYADAEKPTVSDNGGSKTTVSIYHKNGAKSLSADIAEVFKGSTVITNPKPIFGYTCTNSSTKYANVSSAISDTYNAYTPITYTATLKDGNTSSTASFSIDGTNLVLNTPKKDGYVFAGWKATNVAGNTLSKTNFINNKVYTAGTYSGMYGNVTFEAQWKKQHYTVTFDISNGGTNLSASSKTVYTGEAYGNLPTVTPPSGYHFAGWNTSKDGSGTVITASTICNLTSNQTLYACYSNTFYHVAYDNLFIPEKWISNGGNNPSKADESPAVYNANENTISLTYNNRSGVSGSEVTTSTNENSMTIPVTEGTTYSFSVEVSAINATQGWANFQLFVFDNTGYTALCDSNSYVNNNTSKIITSTYTAPTGATKATIRFSNKTTGATINYKNVKFVDKTVADRLDNFVTYPHNYDTVANGGAFGNLSSPTRPGYVFDGWYSDVYLTKKVSDNNKVTSDITLYSKWAGINEVTYDNLFSITDYAASKSPELRNHSGNATIDVFNGSITVPGGTDSTPYTSENTSSDYYTIDIAANTKYYFTFNKAAGDGRIFVFFKDVLASKVEVGKVATVQNIEKSGTGNWIGTGYFFAEGTYSFWFKSPTATKIAIRFDANGSFTRTYSNITLIDEQHYYADSTYSTHFGVVPENTAYGEMPTPTRRGYSFDGWYTASGTKVTSASNTGTANVKLYSKWTESYDIMYNSIFDFDQWGQKANKSWNTATATIDYGNNSYTINANSDTNNELTSGGTGGGANGSNVYAMPVIPNHNYKVSVDIAADSSNVGDKQYNIFVFEYDTLKRIENYERIGDSSNTYTLSPGESGTYTVEFTAEADAHYIALRLASKSSGAGKATFSNIRIQDMTATPYPEASVQLNALKSDSLAAQPERDGYTINGWYDTVNANGTVGGTRYTSLSALTGNKSLYAKYSQATFDVTYVSAYGTKQKVVSLAYGENPTTVYTPTAEGYRFVDWYSDEELITFAPLKVTGPLTLYAKWDPLTYNVGYDNIFLLKSQNISDFEHRDGSTVIETRTVDKNKGTVTMTYQNPSDKTERNLYSDYVELPTTAGNNTYYIISADVATTDCEGRFITFFYDKDGNPCSIKHTNDASHPITEKDGRPNYVETPIYSANTDGHHYYVVKVPEGCKKIRLRFDCLNVDVTKMRKVVFSNIRVVEKTANTYIGATANYSKVDGTVDFGTAYTLPNITNPGYNLVGWYRDAACTVSASSGCNTIGDHTIYSKWETATFKVTFNANGGTCSTASKNVVYNSNFGDLPTPSPRIGFIFKGWYDSIIGGNKITESTVLTDTNDKTLYAHWEHDTFVSKITADIVIDEKLIYGNDIIGMSKNDLANQFSNTNISVSMKSKKMSTGTTINLIDDTDTVYDTITVLIFGDVNGDGWYDGTDAVVVNLIANGMLTREQVGEAVWIAADCNHDGIIDNLDVEILQQAGLLLANVDQTKSSEELQTDSNYIEYLNLIDQNPAVDEPVDKPTSETTFFQWFLNLITKILNYLKLHFAII